mgnify:CR=1 FL=1
MKIHHTVKLVTEIDESKMPSDSLAVLKSLDEERTGQILVQTFVKACDHLKLLEQLNENNTYAVLKWDN